MRIPRAGWTNRGRKGFLKTGNRRIVSADTILRTLIVTRIDRLARSLRDLQNIVHELREKGVHLKATEQPIDTAARR